jgi:hypothetical protein
MKFCKKHGTVDCDSRKRCRKCAIEQTTLYRQKKKQFLVEYKGGKCENCGYSKSVKALTFHHLGIKNFTIRTKIYYSLQKLKKEVDKCVLLCFNCHMELT